MTTETHIAASAAQPVLNGMQSSQRRSLIFVGRWSHGVFHERHVMPILCAPSRPVNSATALARTLRRLRAALSRVATRLVRRNAR